MRHRAHRRRGRNGVVDHERHGRPVDHRCSTGYRSHREVIAAVDATLAAPSFTLSTDAKLTTGTLQSRLIASGSIDFPQLIADMTISVESGNQKGESETRANGTTVWVRADNDGVNELDLPDGKRWVEGGTEQLTEVQIFQQGTRGLLGVLLTLRAAEATETIGTDNLDDTEVTRYRTSVTYEDAVEAAGPDSDALEQALSLDAPTPVNLTIDVAIGCLLYTSPSPRDRTRSRMPSSA